MQISGCIFVLEIEHATLNVGAVIMCLEFLSVMNCEHCLYQ